MLLRKDQSTKNCDISLRHDQLTVSSVLLKFLCDGVTTRFTSDERKWLLKDWINHRSDGMILMACVEFTWEFTLVDLQESITLGLFKFGLKYILYLPLVAFAEVKLRDF